jgi:hypothetical protein
MRVRGAHQLHVRAPSTEIGKARVTALFIRPATGRRYIAVHPPGDDETMSLEVALRRALQPDVAVMPIEASQHKFDYDAAPRSLDDASNEFGSLLQQSPLVVLVPGFSWGLQPELHLLIDRGWLTKTVLIMLPASAGFSLHDRWEQMRSEASDQGLDLPSYTSAGGLLRFNADAAVSGRMPFDTLWEPHRLLDWLADLLRPIGRTDDVEERVGFAELERQGLLRRLRERHPKQT